LLCHVTLFSLEHLNTSVPEIIYFGTAYVPIMEGSVRNFIQDRVEHMIKSW